MLAFGMRLGNDPRVLVTTTPRPVKLIRELLADEGRGVGVTRGTSYENRTNVPPQVFKRIQRYEGTRLGRQELLAELLEDVPGALWSRGLLDATRWPHERPLPELIRVVVAIHAARAYLEAWGKPVAFYSDKHGVFRVDHPGALGGDGMTQFGRALHALNIDIICANSSPAKGRVARTNKTLQDRLVKELRLAGAATLAEGNALLPAFIAIGANSRSTSTR